MLTIASFNVENLYVRPKVFSETDLAIGQPILAGSFLFAVRIGEALTDRVVLPLGSGRHHRRGPRWQAETVENRGRIASGECIAARILIRPLKRSPTDASPMF